MPQTATAIAVHDGARPLFSRRVFERCIAALDTADGAVPAIEVSDTLKRCGEGCAVLDTVDRTGMWAAQTPQVFRAAALRDVYSRDDLDGAGELRWQPCIWCGPEGGIPGADDACGITAGESLGSV